MKVQQRPLWIRDLLDGRRRSVFDLTPAIERLNRELQHVEILEEAKQEAGRIFPIVTKAFMPDQHAERQFDGSVAPILVVRFPTPVEDRDEWSKLCKAWQRPPLTIEIPDWTRAFHQETARARLRSQFWLSGPGFSGPLHKPRREIITTGEMDRLWISS